MKTLPTNVSTNNLLRGSRPRLFVNIANAGKSWATTSDLSGYTNRIYEGVSIRESVDSSGGMSIVSGADLSILKLGESIKFYSEATLYPLSYGVEVGCGFLYKSDLTYSTTRSAESATGRAYSNFIVGRTYNLGSGLFTTYRGYFQVSFSTLSLTSCEDAYIELSLSDNSSDTDFYFKLVEGNWNEYAINLDSYNDFSGWKSGTTDYDGTQLNETFSTSTDIVGNTIRIRLNKAGRDLIVSNAVAGTVLKLMLLSNRDYTYTAEPSNREFVRFNVVNNSTPIMKLIYNTVLPDNQRTRIYLGFEDKSTGLPTAVSSMLNVWSGVVDSWEFNEKLFRLKLRHDDFKRNIKLTSDVLTRTEYVNLPDDNVGKPKPIVIGDFTAITHKDRLGSCLNESNTNNRYGNGDFVKGYVIDNKEICSAIFAGHELKEYGFFWAIWEESVNSFVALAGNLTDETTAGQYTIESGDASKFPYRMVLNSLTNTTVQPVQFYVPSHIQDYNEAENGEYAVDSIYDNWTVLTKANDQCEYGSQLSQWGVNSKVRYEELGLYIDAEEHIAICFESLAESGYESNKVEISFYVYKDDGTAIGQVDNYVNTDGQHIYYYDSKNLSKEYIRIIITVVALSGFNVAKPFKFRNIMIAKTYSKEITKEVFMKCKGVNDTSGAYTGTADTLIENPSDVIRWFAMAKGGLSSSDIDTSFDTARNDLLLWSFAFQWLGEDNSRTASNIFTFDKEYSIISKLAIQCKSSISWTYEGKLTINVFSSLNPFPNSNSNTPDDLDIFEFTGTPDSTSFTRNPIFSYTMKSIDIDYVYNDFVLKYALNYAINDYTEVLYMTNGAGVSGSVETNMTDADFENSQTLTNLKYYTSNSYNSILTTNTLIFEAWAIREEATAKKLLQHLIEWHTKRRWIVRVTTGLNALGCAIGDFINIRFDDIEYLFGTATMNVKKWKVIEINYALGDGKIEIEAIEAETY